jgi:hypothetical protein
MAERISGSEVMTAFSNAVDDGVSSYKMAIFYLGVAAGQCFSHGWSREDLAKELANLELSHPTFAAKIRRELGAVVGSVK